MQRNHIHERIGSRYIRQSVIIGICIVLVLLSGMVWKLFVPADSSGRTTIVLAGDAMTVLSWDTQRRKLGVITIPGEVRVEGVYNSGQLPLSSLVTLEALDPGKSGLLVKSLSDALALPVSGVIRIEGAIDKHAAIDALSPFTLTGWQRRGMDRMTRFGLWWTWHFLRPDAIWTLNIADQGVLRDTLLPDGSTARVFDPQRFDDVAGSLLEIDSIRREMRRVLIVNTTDTAGLGTRVGRVLSRAGMIVAAVETDGQSQDTCSVRAKTTDWDSDAVRFIRKQFGCVLKDDAGDPRVDITVRLGKINATNYLDAH